jgi:ribosomal protein L11 methyltransferase
VLAAFPGALVSEVADGWEDRWREFHHAIEIGPLWVGPPWQTPPSGAVAVVVDPGRAFGTGAHPTTRLCLELLLEEELGSVVDIGCGSGVLSIAAILLGHAPVIAVDLDEVAVEVARENAAANGIELDARMVDARDGRLPEAGLALANISFEAIALVGPRLGTRRAITAGYLAQDRPALPGFEHRDRRQLDGWAADLFERVPI